MPCEGQVHEVTTSLAGRPLSVWRLEERGARFNGCLSKTVEEACSDSNSGGEVTIPRVVDGVAFGWANARPS